MDHPYRYSRWPAFMLAWALLMAACSPQPSLGRGQALQLARYDDELNNVSVSIALRRAGDGVVQLAATFTPPPGFHLYSKDLPRLGKGGQGRPTLLELAGESKMKATGPLGESVSAGPADYEPDGPAVYPVGPVTLTLAVELPAEPGWVDDQLSLTYMACTATKCLPPTIGRLVLVRIPGAGSLKDQ
jgi:hypothetical protein